MKPNVQSGDETAAGGWRLGDLVDFEVLLQQHEKRPGSRSDAETRDRSLPSELTTAPPPEAATRSGLFRHWLEQRRATVFVHDPSPGEQVESLLRWLSAALALCGLLLARGAVFSFFRAPESLAQRAEPINVLWYSAVCIGLPLLLSVGGFWWLLGVRAVPRLPRAPTFVRGALLSLLHPLLTRVVRKITDVSGPEKRLAAQALWGAVRRRAMDRRSAIGLKLAVMSQCFGLGFTVGILLFSWLDCIFYSRVFGWQSTQFFITAEAAHHVVQITAWPWAWFAGEGRGFPTLAQVAATRFVRYQDPALFPADAATAWANYLIAAALIYGLLPRALLFLLSRRELQQALKNPDFGQARFDRLWEHLTKATVEIQGPSEGAAPALPPRAHSRAESRGGGVRCVVVMPEELDAPERRDAIASWLAAEKMWASADVIRVGPEPGSVEALLETIQRASQTEPVARAVFVQESFMPPVKSVLKLLMQIKAGMGGGGVAVGLLGKPSGHPLGEPPSKTDVAVWEAKVLGLGSSGLDIFSFRPPGP